MKKINFGNIVKIIGKLSNEKFQSFIQKNPTTEKKMIAGNSCSKCSKSPNRKNFEGP